MKKVALFAFTMAVAVAPAFCNNQEFDIKRIEVNLVTTPQYTVNPPAKQVQAQKWIAVDVSFDAKPDFSDELIFTYYIYFAKRMFVGQVNHVNIAKGRDLHSVAYISPRSISRILEGKQANISDIENVAVTISKPGYSAPIATKVMKPSSGQWWTVMKQEQGFVMNKNETPFAPLSWDYYEAIKPASSR